MNIELKKLVIADVDSFYNWLLDDEVIKYSLSLFQKLNDKHTIKKWFASLLFLNDELVLGVFIKNTNELIGYAGICCINKDRSVGEYFIFIGKKEYWGKGVSTSVTKKIIELGFNKLKLKKITLSVFEKNIGGLKSYKRAGFYETDIINNARMIDGKCHTKIVMSISRINYFPQIKCQLIP